MCIACMKNMCMNVHCIIIAMKNVVKVIQKMYKKNIIKEMEKKIKKKRIKKKKRILYRSRTNVGLPKV